MSGAIWFIGESEDGRLQSSGAGVATLVRQLAAAAGADAVGLIVGSEPERAARELAGYLPSVLWARSAGADSFVSPSAQAAVIGRLVAVRDPGYVVLPATPAGRELAGALAARLQWGVLTNAVDVSWDGRPIAHSIVFRSDLKVRSAFAGDHGVITLQPNVVTPVLSGAAGTLEEVAMLDGELASPVRRTELVTGTAAASVEHARVIVTGGAGVGSREGWALVESLAASLNAAVGATRPAVDAGWVGYSQQIGQTGKTVRPDLYVALGVSGEVQHRVGMRMARAVVAINTDRDAPIARYSDLFVVGDLAVIVPLLIERLRETRPSGLPG